MTGPEHYAEAERLIKEHLKIRNHGLYTITPWQLTIAQIHATLAVAAAAALRLDYTPEEGNPSRREWRRVAGYRMGGEDEP